MFLNSTTYNSGMPSMNGGRTMRHPYPNKEHAVPLSSMNNYSSVAYGYGSLGYPQHDESDMDADDDFEDHPPAVTPPSGMTSPSGSPHPLVAGRHWEVHVDLTTPFHRAHGVVRNMALQPCRLLDLCHHDRRSRGTPAATHRTRALNPTLCYPAESIQLDEATFCLRPDRVPRDQPSSSNTTPVTTTSLANAKAEPLKPPQRAIAISTFPDSDDASR